MNLLRLFRKTELKLIEKRNESGAKYVFDFKSKYPLDWKAGQDGIFTFNGKKFKGKKYRVFSLASSPDEKNIIIGTNIVENPSEFKAELNSMKKEKAFF